VDISYHCSTSPIGNCWHHRPIVIILFLSSVAALPRADSCNQQCRRVLLPVIIRQYRSTVSIPYYCVRSVRYESAQFICLMFRRNSWAYTGFSFLRVCLILLQLLYRSMVAFECHKHLVVPSTGLLWTDELFSLTVCLSLSYKSCSRVHNFGRGGVG
jgi:hypothetical protein